MTRHHLTLARGTFLILASLVAGRACLAAEAGASPRKVVLIAGPITGHPKDAHEYEKSVILLKHLLDTSPNLKGLRVEAHFKGWPLDPKSLDDADTVVLISDGGDQKESDHPLYASTPGGLPSGERLDALERHLRRGCGFVQIHWTTFHPSRFHDRVTEWAGGYFDYETGPGERKWFSTIEHGNWSCSLPSPAHPVCRGVKPFQVKEELYFNLRFRERDPRVKPLVALGPQAALERTVAWALEREGGGRSFGFTGGHYYENWWNPDFRRLVLNAIAWTAKAEVPASGVESEPAEPIRALIVTGYNHPAHDWWAVTAALIGVLEQDPRLRAEVTEDPGDLGRPQLGGYHLLVLNYSNWDRPGLSTEAKRGLMEYLSGGGGLAVVHFANGAFNHTLPGPDSDWEEYRTRIVRRVWIHGDGRSGHDAFGPFRVDGTGARHPITAGLAPFETVDELYYRQEGTLPIEPLVTGRSKDTGKDEPLAWAYDYGKGRVFQTVLGHSDESVRRAGALIRRGGAWAAGRENISFDPPASLTGGLLFRAGSPWSPEASRKGAAERARDADRRQGSAAPAPAPGERAATGAGADPGAGAKGRFGKALDARAGGIVVAGREECRGLPLTVECWAKLASKRGFNILVASEPKTSPSHWEIYSFAGSGRFSVYLPAMEPAEIQSGTDICDDRWHHLALVHEAEQVRLYVDGREVIAQAIRPGAGPAPVAAARASGSAALGFGCLVTREIGCDGLIDEVRIRNGAHPITALPAARPELDASTIGIWRFEKAETVLPPNPGIDGGAGGHWGIKGEDEWSDPRWSSMDVGPFLSTSLATPGGLVTKGICIRLGSKQEATVCFDTAYLSLRAGWTGGFLKLSPKRFGLIEMPAIDGSVSFQAPEGPGWRAGRLRYRGLHLAGERVVLDYEVDGVAVRDAPWAEASGDIVALTRVLEIGPGERGLAARLAERKGGSGGTRIVRGQPLAVVEGGGEVLAAALRGPAGAALAVRDGSRIELDLPAGDSRLRVKVLLWHGADADLDAFVALAARSPDPEDLALLSRPGPPRWGPPVETKGVLGGGEAPYVIDTLTVPYDNPHGALMFLSGHDFFGDGSAAVSGVHGDVWLVAGIDQKLERLTWRRFATGLYQPLGVKVVGERVHVLGRDQITRLHDENQDGEADFYECFAGDVPASAARHDFITCLETDAAGNFYFVGPTGLHRVSSDGSRQETLATGWRNPNGLSVGPDGTMTVAPQEGEWTPASQICEVKPGGHYGYPGPVPGPERPLGYDLPLCWIPRHADNSTGGQVWVTSDRWGPLAGHLLNLSYGRCSLQLVLREKVNGQPQGGVVPLKGRFLSGAMRGRFHPIDGQLYVTGLLGWTTSAVADGCFQRVRYTGARVRLPVGLHAHANGLRLVLTEPPDRAVAEDVGSYALRRWNYRYAASYGSEEYSVAHPERVGHDAVAVTAAVVLEDARSVFLEIPAMRPAMQMHLKASLRSQDGEEFGFDAYHTVHALAPELDLETVARTGPAAVETAPRGEPGLHLSLASAAGASDARVGRLAALRVPAGTPPSPFLAAGPFRAAWRGRLHVEESGRLRFSAEGSGKVRLSIDGRALIEGEGEDLGRLQSSPAWLRRGDPELLLEYESPPAGDAWIRLFWEGKEFARESIPPGVFRHDPAASELERALRLRQARRLVAERGCLKCHAPEGGLPPGAMPELSDGAPSFAGIGSRLRADWLARRIAKPPAAHPASLPVDDSRSASIAAYLTSLGGGLAGAVSSPAPEAVKTGGELYAKLGCVGCHTLGAGEGEDGRTPLDPAAWKWRPGALAAYLRQPGEHHPAARMPDFRLTETEARSLACFLGARSQPAPESPPPRGDVAEGRRLAAALGCLACHEPRDGSFFRAPSLEAIARLDWSAVGCASPGAGADRGPWFELAAAERQAIRDLAAADLSSLFRESPIEAAERRIDQLRCAACHERDGRESNWASLAGEVEEPSSKPPAAIAVQARPSLTFTGEQLRADWLGRILAGQLDYTLRPWLAARMPAFPAHAGVLAPGMVLGHGCALEPEASMEAAPEEASAGRKLLGPAGGFSCVTCHAVGKEPAQIQQHFGVINLQHSRQRLRREFYLRWMLNPLRLAPLTPMPAYTDEDGRSVLTGVLGGEGRRQFEAIWGYLEGVR